MFAHKLLLQLNTYNSKHKNLYLFGLMLFFWALFDGSFSYMVPIVITESGYSHTMMGLIFASSSLFGAFFDFLLSRFLTKIHYRRLLLFMFILGFITPALLMQTYSFWFFLAAMASWGLYYDLINFGILDFVSRKSPPPEHSHYSGILWVFRALGYTLAPIMIGAVVGSTITTKPFGYMWGVLSIALIIFIFFLLNTKKKSHEYVSDQNIPRAKKISEFLLWRNVAKQIYPVLILTSFFWIYDAFFWTIGPLMNEIISPVSNIGGLFLALYTLPILGFGFIVGHVNKMFGKKRSAQVASFCASILLLCFFITQNPFHILLLVLGASICMAFSMPSLNGAYADYVSESSQYEKEIAALEDFSINIGYIIGPLVAGYLSDAVGNIHSFGWLGIIGIVITIWTFFITPKHITIK